MSTEAVPAGPIVRPWTPLSLELPKSLRIWKYRPPAGWPQEHPLSRRPGGVPVDTATLPPAPEGHVYWQERFRSWPAAGSLVLGLGGIGLFFAGEIATTLLGLVVLGLVFGAGWVSGGWFHVATLSPGRKAFVWTVAIPGIVYGICFIWLLYIHTFTAKRQN